MNHLSAEAKAVLEDARKKGDQQLVRQLETWSGTALPSAEELSHPELLGKVLKESGRLEEGHYSDNRTARTAMDEEHG